MSGLSWEHGTRGGDAAPPGRIGLAPMMAPEILLLATTFAAGSIVGSFVALVADRWPRGEPWAAARSRCRSCDRPLGPAQLVPLISYAVQRGRCAWCRAPLPADLWLGEVGGGLVALLALGTGGSGMAMAGAALFGWAMVLLALIDARHFWLPDAITLPLIVLGLAVAAVMPQPDLLARASGAGLGWAGLEALRQIWRRARGREALGGGDPKLLGAIGAWLGLAALPPVVLIAALGGLGWAAIQALRGRPAGGMTPIPLGTMFALAALLVAAMQVTGWPRMQMV
eukprot:gene6055-6129_t